MKKKNVGQNAALTLIFAAIVFSGSPLISVLCIVAAGVIIVSIDHLEDNL